MNRLQIKIGGLSCSFCAESIRKAYARMEGVGGVNVSLAHEEALVEYDPQKVTESELKETLRQLGYTIRDPKKVRTFEEDAAELRAAKNKLLLAAGFTGVAAALMVAMWLGQMRPWFPWVTMILAVATVFGPGWYILKKAVQALRRGILNQHVLLELGAFAGLTGGFVGFAIPDFPIMDFFCCVTFLVTYHILSEFTSLKVRTRASQAIRKLLALQPATARVVGKGGEAEIPIEEVTVGDLVRVRPGEQIPVDGEVVDGFSGVDESLVTGESIPAEKSKSDEVIGGSLNQNGTLLVRVTRVGEESFLQQIATHIQEARALKPGIVQLVDRILKYYVPGVLVFAGLGFLIWTAGSWVFMGQFDITRAIFSALAVLVMGYPCALGMATPLAMIRGGGMAAERGILMRSAEAFQVMKDIRKIILDKTGTLTRGEPRVVDVVALSSDGNWELLGLAAAVERTSEHPLARAIVERAESEGLIVPQVDNFQSTPGKGVSALFRDQELLVGSLGFLEEKGIDTSAARSQAEELQSRGRTVIGLGRQGTLAALIAIADTLKEDAKGTIEQLKQLGIEPLMITGDNPQTARAVAAEVGIDQVMAQVLPDRKAAEVRRLQDKGYRVAMVGDGINDAPALMQADVGFAIGAGTDIAIESADVILIGERLGAILDAFQIGKNSYRKTVENLILAFSFNGIGVPLATTGLVHPVWAMIAMVASVSTVLLNSFAGRLLPKARSKKPREITFKVPTMHCQGCLGTKPADTEEIRCATRLISETTK